MCGLAGFVGLRDELLIRRMTQAVVHRGPDGVGFFIDSEVSLGHRRLSVIDLSQNGKQPIFNEDKSIALIYNGEIFNFQELREELAKKGHQFRSKTDSEVIVHAYEEWGINSVKKFRGFFAYALWDKKDATLYLVRDRIGVKPLYYYQENSQLFFASEIKAIIENKKIVREVNEKALFEYLAFQASLGEQTLFAGIKKVPPATVLIFKEGKIAYRKYWRLEPDDKISKLSEGELENHFRQLLSESVKIRLISDVPLGVLLSGGLDSSSIVALMSQITSGPIKTFSVGFGQPDDELKYARIVARKFKTNHRELIIKPGEIKKVLRKIIFHQDEPLADGGGIATYLAAQAVSRHVKVVLVGEGGDELFGGYSWYKLGVPPMNFLPELIRKKVYFYLTTFAPGTDALKGYQKKFSLAKGSFLSKMIRFEIENVLPNSLCMKVDKMMSAWGLEAREPFLDYKLAEFCFSLAGTEKVNFTKGKVLFRKVMKEALPKEILERKKHGFLLPTGKWLRRDLKGFAKEVLLDRGSLARRYYSQNELVTLFRPKKMLAEIERINLLWRLLIFELWYKIYFK